MSEPDENKINTSRFYYTYKGHPVSDLHTLHTTARSLRPGKPIIYLAGDSSLDNKHWLPPSTGIIGIPLPVPIPSIYPSILSEPHPKADIAFWLNHLLGPSSTAINAAVEESTLRERESGKRLLEQDTFIRDTITSNDILIVSVGGNDIALKPTFSTLCHMLVLAWLTPVWAMNSWTLRHFVRLFRDETAAYIASLVSVTKPKAVIVCMIYYPLEVSPSRSWADLPLRALGYNLWPGRLQGAIRRMYEVGTRKVKVEGTRVVGCGLWEVLDGKGEGDYVERVEPSVEGGRKMAGLLGGVLGGLGVGGEREL